MDQELARTYGNTKTAESPLLAALMGLGGAGMLEQDRHHVGDERRELAVMELMARRQEAARQQSTRQGMRGKGGIAPDSTDYAALSPFDPGVPDMPAALPFQKGGSVKEALNMGAMVQGVGRGLGALGRGVQSAGQGLAQGFGATGRLARAAGPELMAGIQSGAAPAAGGLLGSVGRGLEQGGAAVAQRGGAMTANALKPATMAAPAFAAKPLLGAGTKLKMLGLAGTVGAGMAGMKGMGAARDYMMMPAGQHHQGYLRGNVNEYGY